VNRGQGPGPGPGPEPTPDFDITGTYKFTQTGDSTVYTWVFSDTNDYTVTRSVGSTVNTGTYSVSGNEITITTAALTTPVNVPSFSEVFTITSSGDNVTLTLKGSASASNFFTSIGNGGALTTITMTKQSGNNGGGNECTECNNDPCTCEDEGIPFLAHQVSAGANHTVAIKTDGSLWAWGDNRYGQLGDGTWSSIGETINSPTRVGTDNNWASISAGFNNRTVAIKTDGSLWAWGANLVGSGSIATPTRVGTDNNWASVSTGSNHTVAMKTDGSLWAWGDNSFGQLGLGDTTYRNTPTRVGTDNNWASVFARWNSTFAMKTDGSLWAWGSNSSGQLGLGDTTDRNTPTRVGTDNNWASISAGRAIKTDGSLWAWGHNGYSQLGLGDTTDRNTPTRVGTDSNWEIVFAGGSYTMAIKTDGSLWAWGGNNSGELGLGDSSGGEYVPTQVFVIED